MELWRKTEILEGSKSSKFRFEVQNLSFEDCFEVKMIFKSILEVPALIPAQFPYIRNISETRIAQNDEKLRGIGF